MTSVITKHNLFRPLQSKSETKAQITDHTARAIIGAEAERRDAKTARLRAVRLAAQAVLVPAPALAKQRGGATRGCTERALSSTLRGSTQRETHS